MLTGLDFLLTGDAGALTVDALKKKQKNNFLTFTALQNHSPILLNSRNS